MPIELDPSGQQLIESVEQHVPQSADPVDATGVEFGYERCVRRRRARRPGRRFRFRAQSAFLPTAIDERLQPHTGTDIQGADALGRVHLVTGDGEQIDAPGSDVDGNLPAAWAASVWKRTSRAWAMAASSVMGCSTPVSLLAAMIDTSTVSGVSAFASAVGSIRPSWSTGRYLTWTPCSRCSARQVSKTAGCSLAWVMICAGAARSWAKAAPRMARLLASDPLAVNTISAGSAPIRPCEPLAPLCQRAAGLSA